MKDLTAAVVHCNTPELLSNSIWSIRKYYPDLDIFVIDNSQPPIRGDIKLFLDDQIELTKMGGNIGHGPGMDYAIHRCPTKYMLLFDTDIEMKEPCLEEMLELFEEDTLSVGQKLWHDQSVYNIKFGEGGNIPMIHPFFHIVQRKVYEKYLPYVQNGGPTFLTNLDVYSRGLSDKILKNFDVKKYVWHRNRGTRDVIPPNMFKGSTFLDANIVNYLSKNWREHGSQ